MCQNYVFSLVITFVLQALFIFSPIAVPKPLVFTSFHVIVSLRHRMLGGAYVVSI